MIEEIRISSRSAGNHPTRYLVNGGLQPVGYDEKPDGTFTILLMETDVSRAIQILELAGFSILP